MKGIRLGNNGFAWLLLLPSLAILALFTFYPIFLTLRLSFFQADLATPEPIFAELDNFRRLAEDEVFWKVMRNNSLFAAGTVPAGIALALLMAVFANKAIRGKALMRTGFFYPTLIPMIAAANIWLFIYTPEYGLVSRMLSWTGQPELNWLGTPGLVMWAMIIMIIWKESGYLMIFYLAGLQNIPRDLYEAAQMDGVGAFTVFRKITFPLLMPTTLFVSIIALTNAFKLVDHLMIMTRGGPNNASNLLLYYIYETAFSFWDQGLASALTVIMIGLMLLFAAVQFFGLDKRIHYN
ncbi:MULTISPECIES: carbohydrate ABC transporter permease [Paenibacillus]|uniref:Binding--dependent transport system inner membrane component family protein n=1 Tax=Paenibacillus macerans TaxID=44252 RepID=A0A090ZCQ3_PAEMA|nr:sugar ABC transporter permease [Paenibacillus macerans]KFN08000.1 binding--dependent transport system inner membrane component family protein [Paenibacillus macerans]MCY7556813.1 sugar ABC transporter permease [Paenibacillus macerans]MEC0152039.1 sugar ABC transporter permease [Paenibacillus macerans]MEC0328500.1 sugar ABC transporter permease [Paenibacillus macerans]SUA84991.1 CUT1 family carbohydrate ABC transporter membrane protein 1 [Paenibacillus macerans]